VTQSAQAGIRAAIQVPMGHSADIPSGEAEVAADACPILSSRRHRCWIPRKCFHRFESYSRPLSIVSVFLRMSLISLSVIPAEHPQRVESWNPVVAQYALASRRH
jgi:hypothetical protein